MRLRVELVENRGSQKFLYGSAEGGAEAECRGGPRLFGRSGEPISITIAPENLLFFDAATGKRIGRKRSEACGTSSAGIWPHS